EDAGIVELARVGKERYGIVFAHESHNHPSQIVPYEGAATGIGGIVRDVACMGAKVIAVADPLRFGDVNVPRSKWIVGGVVGGIGGYGNPIGVPNIAGDAYFSASFNENCLVNVVSLGLVRESGIIHSKAPQGAGEKGYDLILVGKPTDNSGFGGASFASFELDAASKDKNKGAVQEPNAFLKRHLLEATWQLCNTLRERGLINQVGFKDLGAGGILCASVELVDAGGYGAEIDLEAVHVAMPNLPPQVILAAETQERFMWVTPPEITALVLKHYNETWALPQVSKGARASVIGKVRVGGEYVVMYRGERVIAAKACDITQGIKYDRTYEAPATQHAEPPLPEPAQLGEVLLKILAHENVASRACLYERYDKTVQGITVLEPGQADAGVMQPLIDEDVPDEVKRVGLALAVDSNPFFGRLSPYWGAATAVVEAMRNVAAVGAMPWAVTDCLNYGNPEKPHQMWQLTEGIRGVGDACRGVHLKGFGDSPVPVVSGNVSLYNESKAGAVDPSAIIACLGRVEDVSKVITMEFKSANSEIYLLGERKDELGGSVYYQLHNELGKNVPQVNFKQAEGEIYTVIDAISTGVVVACHDISDGGLGVTLAEMCFGGGGQGTIGVEVDLAAVGAGLPAWKKLFSETGGFVLEVKEAEEFKSICARYDALPIHLGTTTSQGKLVVREGEKIVLDAPVAELARAWQNGLRDKLV
ncbi:MAG: phosphoribosylformylglycinamidine synthase subunit PurL, partial [Candidatus Veblenbacteria bacterium]|nr:phosphoribosylformylglycinamidine synthase subunit PurL [Candidatus Veblenbacteria bacterium]